MNAMSKEVKLNSVRGVMALAVTFALAACGGGGAGSGTAVSQAVTTTGASGVSSSGSSTANGVGSSGATAAAVKANDVVTPVTRADAQRLLEQAAFGPTEADIASVQSLGVQGWINQQMSIAATGYPGFFYVDPFKGASCTTEANIVAKSTDVLMKKYCSRDYYTAAPIQRAFFVNALNGQDQLRQRVAFALSQIFVTSGYEAYAQADYQNMLLNDAFANFKTIMTDVTLHPTMGDWLDMVTNDKPNPTKGTQANENYAREFMQLFTVGPNMLNSDGSFQLDANGKSIPTYTQDQVTALARAFTGWAYPPVGTAAPAWNDGVNHAGKMVAFDAHHDMDAKTIIGNVTLPAGQGAQADLDAAVSAVFNHPNVGPFIVKQLIQKLVLSNPSPAYVQRVVAVFNNNGSGVRGDMAAVVSAILTDSEARGDNKTASDYGKLREPAVYMASLLRTLGGTTDGVGPSYWSGQQGEPIFQSPSVFNYYSPSYNAPGTTLNGPEFGILDTSSQLARSNFMVQMIYTGGIAADTTVTGAIGTHVNMANFGAFTDRGATVDKFNDVLMHGTLTAAGKAAVLKYLNALSDAQIASHPTLLSSNVAYLLSTTSLYEIEK